MKKSTGKPATPFRDMPTLPQRPKPALEILSREQSAHLAEQIRRRDVRWANEDHFRSRNTDPLF